MFAFPRTRAIVLSLAFGLTALLSGVPLAVAQRPVEPDGGGAVVPLTPTPAPSVSHGSPLWVFIVVAAVTAALTILAMWLVASRVRHPRQLSASRA